MFNRDELQILIDALWGVQQIQLKDKNTTEIEKEESKVLMDRLEKMYSELK